ncbi:glycine betaine transporter subunit; ATP-binding compoent of ABC superfamily [Planktothrix sp. PCC 11201]|uniref:quaternary amine ABC transporter ATP-binding protein n=1 Tax=Planktothrix sp. PCC 11201 TaxID=1729650 RepID=UPI000916E68C|nr:glycine betaine/L-proline ABC transporter ATP-binding protein [Planktothrix sp. PCC 11201]SKB12988.1 glycine betaine transporter subunit; ATP-binding compoent of ABC superfamily [Planktothrix sp. PCC 11201]
MSDPKPKIRIEHLIKIYGENCGAALKLFSQGASREAILQATGQVLGIADVSLTINPGEIFVVMGLSGSGKSTLIRCINRLIAPTRGHIYIDDEDIAYIDEKRIRQIRLTKVSMVFQHFGLFPHRTVVNNVEYGLKLLGMSKTQRRRKALATLEVVGLAPWADYRPSALSGGMQQRVGLARALATDAEILLMDEPFSALDPLTRREMQNELLRLQKELNKTIVFITHDTPEALKLGDRIAVMKEGVIVQLGTPKELLNQPTNDYIRDFIQDVNRGQILKAGTIARPTICLILGQDLDQVKLQQIQNQNLQRIYILNPDQEPIGFIDPQQLDLEIQQDLKDITNQLIQTNFSQVKATAPLEDIFHLYRNEPSLVVVDETGKFQGVLEQADVLASLSRFGEVFDPQKEPLSINIAGENL